MHASRAASLRPILAAASQEFLASRRQNVTGVAIGVKWKGGQPTGEEALIVLVTHKLPEDNLRPSDVVPRRLKGVQTDVLAVGNPFAGNASAGETLARRIRPARPGYSVGHETITAGTIGAIVHDILPEGTISPPVAGVGRPEKYYILSNNHVLAASNEGQVGDPIIQPGRFDGGTDPEDRIAMLSRFVPLDFEPPIPRENHTNIIDAAVAEANFENINRDIFWIGPLQGWRRKESVTVGTVVQKTGRTTHYTVGRITAVQATIDINYRGGRVARFNDQIIATSMSEGGDSGSLIVTLDNVAVGLLVGGTPQASILSQIENVRALLRVEIAQQIL